MSKDLTFTKGLLLPAVNVLLSKDPNDVRYPERYRNKKMKNWKVITLDFEHGIGQALRQLNKEMGLLLKLYLDPSFNVLVARILKRMDIQQEFKTLFLNYTVYQLFDKKLKEQYSKLLLQLNVQTLSKEYMLNRVYKVLMNSILSKAINKNIKDKDYTKISIPLRVQEKIKSMQEKTRTKPLAN